MADGLLNKNMRRILIYRGYTENGDLSSTLYTAPSQFKVGIEQGATSETDSDLDVPIPIDNGTVLDEGDNTMTGSNGGSNTTDNTTTYKEGAGVFDDTAQNLITNTSSISKVWDLTLTTAFANSSQPFAAWIYIKDQTTLDYFATSTCVRIGIGSDTSNYYYKTWDKADLAVGWNWLNSGTTALGSLSSVGTPTGDLDTLRIIITTNNATDSWSSGDVIYDLLRQWESADLFKDFQTGYPTFDYSLVEVTTRCYINSLEANGFLLDVIGHYNKDTTPLLTGEDTYDDQSKSRGDEFAFVAVDRVI